MPSRYGATAAINTTNLVEDNKTITLNICSSVAAGDGNVAPKVWYQVANMPGH